MSKRAQPLLSKQRRLDLVNLIVIESHHARSQSFPSIPTKILLPIDFSPSSQAALDMAADLAQHFQAELYLVNVIPEFPTTTIPDFIPEDAFLENARKYAEVHLAKCKAALQTRGVKSTFSVEVGNDVVGNIMEVVDREHIDMIVISTHGISGWHPLVFGSIAEKVVKLAQCPLLLLHSAKPEESEREDDLRPLNGMVVARSAVQVANGELD
jgi:nucleotide-binding universal stress UspA family protein